jgi:hypothetical protein
VCRLVHAQLAFTTEESYIDSRQGQEIFLFPPECSNRPRGSHSLLVQWLPVIERTGREADHSAASCAKAKNEWGHTSIPQCLRAINRGRLHLRGLNLVLQDEKPEVYRYNYGRQTIRVSAYV